MGYLMFMCNGEMDNIRSSVLSIILAVRLETGCVRLITVKLKSIISLTPMNLRSASQSGNIQSHFSLCLG